MQANGLKVTEKEIEDNTDVVMVNKFILAYQAALAERAVELTPSADEDENFQ